jgi:hypothetical protein
MAEDPGVNTGEVSNLLQNKLLMQYLSELGGAINSGQPVGPAMNKVTQSNIQSQNMMKLLKTLLGPDGTKATFSNTGMNLTVPKETDLFKSLLEGGGNIQPDISLAPSTPVAAKAPTISNSNVGGGGFINPFVEGQPTMSSIPSISGADLAGLTSQDISTALGLKHGQDTLKQQSYRDMVDAVYKGHVIKQGAETASVTNKYHTALTKKAEADIENDSPIYQTDQGIKLNAKDYLAYQKLTKESQTPAMKNYEYAQKQGFKGSFIDFENNAKTTHMKDYEGAKGDGYKGTFHQWMLEMAKAGAINLGDVLKKESELSKLQGEKYFGNPDWTKDLQSHVGSKDIQNRISDVQVPDVGTNATKEQKQTSYRGAVAKERARVTIEFIEGKIAAGGGKVIANPTMDKDGKTVTWKVKWPTGNTTEVTQAIR